MVQRSSKNFISKPDLVDTTLIYPVSVTTDPSTSGGTGGLTITGNQSAPIAQQLMIVQKSDGTVLWDVPVAGGPKTNAKDIRSYNQAGTAYAALNGSQTYGCVELPDGTSGQGSKIWSGSGAPSASTVGAATAGDYYFRRAIAEVSTLIAASATNTATQTTLAVGSGTLSTTNTDNLKDGVPVAGDLLIICVQNTNTTVTLSIGSDSGITDSSADGGYSANDGTRYNHFYSRIIQSGDISGNQILITPSAHSTGSGRRISAWIFHNSGGWTAQGSKHGAQLYNSVSSAPGNGTSDITLSITGYGGPSVAIAAEFSSNTAQTTTYYWDNGDNSNIHADMPSGGTFGASVSVKPGIGTNTSGATGYTSDGSLVVLSNVAGTKIASLAVWAVATPTFSANPTVYVCTASGTPGTWSSVL